jgi:hypothetical protein
MDERVSVCLVYTVEMPFGVKMEQLEIKRLNFNTSGFGIEKMVGESPT